MFYYKITVRRKHGPTRSATDEFREALVAEDIGCVVACHWKRARTVTGISVKRISQATYMRETGAIE